jgi:hypothetical protein
MLVQVPLHSFGLVLGQRQQRLSPGAQPLATHCFPPWHFPPQRPQLAMEVSFVQVYGPHADGQQSHGPPDAGHVCPFCPQHVRVLPTAQTPAQQACGAGQTVPHAPQLSRSRRRSLQVPLQLVHPAPQRQAPA